MKLTGLDLIKGRLGRPRKLASERNSIILAKYGVILKYPYVKPDPRPTKPQAMSGAAMNARVQSFRLAHMSPLIWVLTLVLLAIPIWFLSAVILGSNVLVVPALCLIVLYAWVWLRFRPTRFILHQDKLEVLWPLKRRSIPRKDITEVRLIDRRTLREETGWCMRVGVGGLWGGFGWLWTQRRGVVRMYISRTDGFVWIERVGDRPWLITPEQPEVFVRAFSR